MSGAETDVFNSLVVFKPMLLVLWIPNLEFVSDIFGYEAPNLRKLADKVAAAGFYVVVPDFLHGDSYVPKNSEKPLPIWIKSHGTDKGAEKAKPVIEALKSRGISAVGAAGMCWGAKVVGELGKSDDLKAIVMAHHSFVTVDDIKDVESARPAPFKVPSPTTSAASKGEQLPLQCRVETQKEATAVNVKHEAVIPQQSFEKGKATKAVSEATSMSVKDPALQVKKKKKKKVVLPINGADMQWRTPQDLGYENHMMPFPPAACNPYWGGMPLGMEGYMGGPYMVNMGNMGHVGNMSNIPYGL